MKYKGEKSQYKFERKTFLLLISKKKIFQSYFNLHQSRCNLKNEQTDSWGNFTCQTNKEFIIYTWLWIAQDVISREH